MSLLVPLCTLSGRRQRNRALDDAAAREPAIAGKATIQVDRWELIAIALVVVAIVLTRATTLNLPLLEGQHPARQTQTAFQTVGFYENGIDLLHPTVPVLGSPWELPFEFPAFQAVASIPMSWGVSADAANRSTALFFFTITGVLLWALTRRLSNPTIALIALIAFSFSPFALLWSRASLMEYLATAATLAWILVLMRLRERARWHWAIAAALIGALAMSVKITSALPWIPLALLYSPEHERTPRKKRARSWIARRADPRFLTALLVPIVVAAAWTRHADAIKAASPTTAWGVSANIRSRGLGSLGQRLDIGSIGVVLDRVESYIIGHGVLLILIAVVLLARRHRAAWVGILLVPAVAIGGIFTLYVIHDYYLIAVSPALAALVGLAIWSVVQWSRVRKTRQPVALVAVTAVWLGFTMWLATPYWSMAFDGPTEPPVESVEIAANTAPDELIFVGGFNWDPRILYYAQRRGLMLYEGVVTPQMVAQQPDLDQYTAAFFPSPIHHQVDWIASRPWYAPETDHMLALGSTAADVSDFDMLATTRPVEDILGSGIEDSILPRSELTCDGVDSITVPAGDGTLIMEVASEGTGRVVMDAGLIAVPAAARTLIWKQPDGSARRPAARLTCINGGILHVLAVIETTQWSDGAAS